MSPLRFQDPEYLRFCRGGFFTLVRETIPKVIQSDFPVIETLKIMKSRCGLIGHRDWPVNLNRETVRALA